MFLFLLFRTILLPQQMFPCLFPRETILGKNVFATMFPRLWRPKDVTMLGKLGNTGVAEANSSQLSRAGDTLRKPILLLENKKTFLPQVKTFLLPRHKVLPLFYQFSHPHESNVD